METCGTPGPTAEGVAWVYRVDDMAACQEVDPAIDEGRILSWWCDQEVGDTVVKFHYTAWESNEAARAVYDARRNALGTDADDGSRQW